jgi:hypothetical protein
MNDMIVRKMTLSFEIEIDDIIAFYSNHYDNEPVNNKWKKYWWITPVLLIYLGVIFYFEDRNNWTPIVIVGILALALVLIRILHSKSRWQKQLRKTLDVPENAIWFGERTMEFSDEQVITHVEGISDETLSWKAFVRISETPEYFFLYISAIQAHVVPKRAMTATQIKELTQLLNDKVPYQESDQGTEN